MDELTVLSPHRDDAVFSLYICLSRWRSAPVRVTVLNFFTESGYAPRAFPLSRASVPALRAREDRHALRAIDGRIRIKSAGLVDAPLRLGIEARHVCSPEARAYDDSGDAASLRAVIRAQYIRGLALAPLGLGNHVDHLLVNKAATQTLPGCSLAFYEDLPYATWTSEAELKRRVRACEETTMVRLKSAIVRGEHAAWRKREIGVHYGSQITPREAAEIARFALRYRGGERIWIPKHSTRWRVLVNSHA
jgi:LmbE family N-acetylglucosaminyl deacetylase